MIYLKSKKKPTYGGTLHHKFNLIKSLISLRPYEFELSRQEKHYSYDPLFYIMNDQKLLIFYNMKKIFKNKTKTYYNI